MFLILFNRFLLNFLLKMVADWQFVFIIFSLFSLIAVLMMMMMKREFFKNFFVLASNWVVLDARTAEINDIEDGRKKTRKRNPPTKYEDFPWMKMLSERKAELLDFGVLCYKYTYIIYIYIYKYVCIYILIIIY